MVVTDSRIYVQRQISTDAITIGAGVEFVPIVTLTNEQALRVANDILELLAPQVPPQEQELQKRIKELEALAYIGEHHFPIVAASPPAQAQEPQMYEPIYLEIDPSGCIPKWRERAASRRHSLDERERLIASVLTACADELERSARHVEIPTHHGRSVDSRNVAPPVIGSTDAAALPPAHGWHAEKEQP
jgi:hypothetical protein